MSENFDHAQEAERYLRSAAGLNATADAKVAKHLQRQAQAHATLAQVDVLREIAETLASIRTFGTAQTR